MISWILSGIMILMAIIFLRVVYTLIEKNDNLKFGVDNSEIMLFEAKKELEKEKDRNEKRMVDIFSILIGKYDFSVDDYIIQLVESYIANDTQRTTLKTLNDLRNEAFENAKNKGWHDEERTVGELIALMHAELSEALEEHRKGFDTNEIYKHIDNPEKPEGIPVELADTIIRILDFCGLYNIDIEKAVLEKMNYNKTRPYRHGNKVI